MSGGNGYLSISRERSVSNALRGFALLIDDKTVDKIRSGETKKYALPSGSHTVRIAIDLYKSKPLAVDLHPGETLTLVCGDVAPKTLGESFSLKGMGQSLKALSSPGDYLFVNLVGGERAVAGAERTAEVDAADPRSSTARRPKHADQTLFVSYRREDSRAITGRICDRLTAHFGKQRVFRDVDSIPVGMDFRDKIRETIDGANLLIAIIGPHWVDIRNRDGEVRLGLADDYVRLEIESALSKGIPVIPVLVDDAAMPQAAQLPESIARLAYLNAMFIPPEPFFHAGVDKLIEEIGRHGAKPRQQFCLGCGRPLSSEQHFCTGCGRPSATP
ncbi:MAG: TIR domain-containing protein [Chromatiaceae bacterium]|jgi:hypothetical protein|nr:TIR domain-containing protein [Chromatiaceae bacterium]